MNKAQLKKSVGCYLQLRPVPRTRDGAVIDDDWVLSSVTDDRLELHNIPFGYVATLGTDHVYSFMTNPARDAGGVKHGFLSLHVQLILDGPNVRIEPHPPPRSQNFDEFFHPHSFSPLIVEDKGYPRYFSWRGRDPLHLIRIEDTPRQLLEFERTLCDALRGLPHSKLKPQFNVPNRITGEIVYELSPDFRAKWRLLGGMGTHPSDQVLVLVSRKR